MIEREEWRHVTKRQSVRQTCGGVGVVLSVWGFQDSCGLTRFWMQSCPWAMLATRGSVSYCYEEARHLQFIEKVLSLLHTSSPVWWLASPAWCEGTSLGTVPGKQCCWLSKLVQTVLVFVKHPDNKRHAKTLCSEGKEEASDSFLVSLRITWFARFKYKIDALEV